jgi:hypothetical protein
MSVKVIYAISRYTQAMTTTTMYCDACVAGKHGAYYRMMKNAGYVAVRSFYHIL